MSSDNTITKTVRQYSKALPKETMDFLKGIALDYSKVRNYVYGKYAGVHRLDSLTPVYGILNEMRHCGLREQLNFPAVYYELAVTDAVADIKRSWGIVKNKVGERITANENLSDDDRIYLRTVLKIGSVYAAILNRREYETPKNAKDLTVDTKRLNNLLCRLTRRYLTVPQTKDDDWFRISPNGYSYRDGEIRIVCRTPRKRISIPLRDEREFDRQIRVQIRNEDVVLAVPVEVKIRSHNDYCHTIYAYIGRTDMITLSNGAVYGERLEEIVDPETERLAEKNRERRRMYKVFEKNVKSGNERKAKEIETNNLGRQKYERQKEKEKSRTTTFINAEINRMLRNEKPARIVITRPVQKNKAKFYAKTVNRRQTRSFEPYIRERLAYKCNINSIELVEINAKGAGKICAECGAQGKRQGKEFICELCGAQTTIAINFAKNIRRKYSS